MEYFEIRGGKKLKGSITVNSSKNAAIALLTAALINKGVTVLRNVPRIEEVNRLLEVLKSLGVKFSFKEHVVKIITPDKFNISSINRNSAKQTRCTILLLGALAGMRNRFSLPQSGGCRLGSRTINPHLMALEELGLKIKTQSDLISVDASGLRSAEKIVLYETGDTATENVLLAAAQVPGKTTVKLASANYMVQDLCYFLEKLGVKIKGIGTGTLEIEGLGKIRKKIEYSVSEDPIEAMLFLSAAIVTKSRLEIKRCPLDFLELELLKLAKMGLRYKITRSYLADNNRTALADILVIPSSLKALEDKIHPLPSAGVNIDNLPFFVPIACVAQGRTLIHDWVYENRAIYFTELNKLGGKVQLLDPHRVYIDGPVKFQAAEVICPPALRPSVIILIAMLAAPGRSVLKNVYPINRGYEKLEERLGKIGADVRFYSEKK